MGWGGGRGLFFVTVTFHRVSGSRDFTNPSLEPSFSCSFSHQESPVTEVAFPPLTSAEEERRLEAAPEAAFPAGREREDGASVRAERRRSSSRCKSQTCVKAKDPMSACFSSEVLKRVHVK